MPAHFEKHRAGTGAQKQGLSRLGTLKGDAAKGGAAGGKRGGGGGGAAAGVAGKNPGKGGGAVGKVVSAVSLLLRWWRRRRQGVVPAWPGLACRWLLLGAAGCAVLCCAVMYCAVPRCAVLHPGLAAALALPAVASLAGRPAALLRSFTSPAAAGCAVPCRGPRFPPRSLAPAPPPRPRIVHAPTHTLADPTLSCLQVVKGATKGEGPAAARAPRGAAS